MDADGRSEERTVNCMLCVLIYIFIVDVMFYFPHTQVLQTELHNRDVMIVIGLVTSQHTAEAV